MKKMSCKCIGLVVLTCLISFGAWAQRDPMKFGKIDPAEMNMERYEADTTAKALILGDFGVVEILYNNERGFEYTYTRHLRVKIFNKDALGLANFKIYLYGRLGEQERLTTFKGTAYNHENGKIVESKIRRTAGFDEEISENVKAVVFTLPNVREGSLFEIEYSMRSPFLYSLPTWNFQGEYPAVFSEFRTFIPEYFYYKQLMQGFLTLGTQTSDVRSRSFDVVWHEELQPGGVTSMPGSTRRTQKIDYQENMGVYRINNVPAFTTEPYMNAYINYITKIEHELQYSRMPSGQTKDYSTNWQQLTKLLMESESFGRQLIRSNFIKDEVETIKAGSTDQLERMIAAFKLVQNNMTWNKSNGIYSNRNLSKSWNEKQGNVADINLMLVVVLRDLGINADPMVLSTRNNGVINPAQIMLDKFNYVVAHAVIDGNTYLMDATEKHTPYFLLPERCINGEGRLISETHSKWVKINPELENMQITKSTIRIAPCGTIETQLQREETSYYRYDLEQEYREYTKVEDFMDKFEMSHPGVNLNNVELFNLEDWSKPLVSIYDYDIPAIDATPKDILYINPLLNDRLEANPFRLEQRLFPVDFISPFKEIHELTIQIPEGYNVEELPDSKDFYLPGNGGRYQCTYNVVDDGNIIVQISMFIGKPIFLPTEYQLLREFYAIIVEEQARNIVLKKA